MYLFFISITKCSEVCAARLCSHTFSGGLNPETSMALEKAVSDVSALVDSAKDFFQFHLLGSHFEMLLVWSFPFSLLRPFLLACSGRASVAATEVIL